jgi:guanylate kinase|nr:MAG TPA: GMPK protein [Caudoviricetes sp.]
MQEKDKKKKYKLIALCGKSAVGKDTILNEVIGDEDKSEFFHKIVSVTTRPKRKTEVDGVDYYFVDDSDIPNLRLLELEHFNGWAYGTMQAELEEDRINLGIFTPRGIAQLAATGLVELTVVIVESDADIRLSRSLLRSFGEQVLEMCRRNIADAEDFSPKVLNKMREEYPKVVTIKNNNSDDFKNAVTLIRSLGVALL